jgi:hypothetical protein
MCRIGSSFQRTGVSIIEIIQPKGSPIKTAKPIAMAVRFNLNPRCSGTILAKQMRAGNRPSSEIDAALITLQLH